MPGNAGKTARKARIRFRQRGLHGRKIRSIRDRGYFGRDISVRRRCAG